MKNKFNNRKTLYLVLSMVLVSIFTLTIAYAALNTVLKITGSAEVVASSWDIYLDNPQVISGSATTSIPTINNKTTATFSTTLTNPGDYYMFTIDVVNNGSIDAMIDSIEKLPQLNETQAKYLNYIVEYQSGESINTKQLVEANSFVRLKVKVEFRKDLVASDLPSQSETLNLSFKVNYVQAEETGTSIVPNSGKLVKIVSGDYDTVGSEICIGEECFYVISSTENDVTMLAKYNLYVGAIVDENWNVVALSNPTGIQDAKALGVIRESEGVAIYPWIGTVMYAKEISTYDESVIKEYVNDYVKLLSNYDIQILEGRLISLNELESLGCSSSDYSCTSSKYNWLYTTSYWTGTGNGNSYVWYVYSFGSLGYTVTYSSGNFGVRPVITISKSAF